VIRAVAVDIDDTLVLTEAVSFELENEVLAGLGRAPMPRAVHVSTWGQPLLEAIGHRSPGVDTGRFAAAFPPVFGRYVADGRIDAVAPDNLAALAGRLSGAYHLGNVRHPKPDPRAFDELLADGGLAPGECVYVGDSPSDARAANGAGVRFVACLQSGLRTPEHFAGCRVDAFIDAFPGIVDAVAALGRER
jgi:phosphoglycolate phosphatase-like HAD superfamily hydrolase